jgi:glycosyltransferase involved in cell wall biosynthesis
LKKVLFISYDGLTDSLGQSQVLPYYIGLSKLGHEITILSCEKPINYKKNREVVAQKCKSNGITWDYTFYKSRIPVISPTINNYRLKKKAKIEFKYRQFDIVHCRSIIPAAIGYELCKKSSAKLVYDIRGFWADERVDGKTWDLSNPIYNFIYKHFKKKENFLFEKSYAIVTLTENAKGYIQEHFETNNKFAVVPCCVDMNHFDAKKIKQERIVELKTQLKISEKDYVLTYVGSLGARYMLNEMLAFYKLLSEKKKNAKFLFISKSDTSEIESICLEMGIDPNKILITSCEYTEIPTYISIGNASVFFIVTSFSGKAVSPTKQAEVMSLGLPIVANTGLGDTDAILKRTESGVVIQDFTEKEYNNAITELLAFNKPKNEIREAAIANFSLSGGIEKYAQLYNSL